MKRWMAYALSLSILLSVLPVFPAAQVRAAEELISWLQTSTMDVNLNVIEGKAGTDDLLFELNLAEPNTHAVEYFLNSGERRSLAITNSPEDLQIDFWIEKGNKLAHQNVTEAEMDISFLSVDYSGDIPQWKSYRGAELAQFKARHLTGGKIRYTIDKKASSKFPGIAFNINNRILMLRGDFSSSKAYLYLDKYQVGTIFPIHFTTPLGQTGSVNALKSLKDFTTLPTHLVKNPALGINEEPTPIVVPNVGANTEKAGSRPGIRLQFEQPKALNKDSWQFDFDSATDILKTLSATFDLKDLAGPANMDIRFSLDTAKRGITSLPAGNTGNEQYRFDPAKKLYQIDIVKDKSDLANKDTELVEWKELEKSKIYKAKLNFEKSVGKEGVIDFPAFSPNNEFAYTYMEFTLKRADQKEAFLEITPYDVGDNVDLEYTILYNKTYVGPLNENNHLWLRHYQRNDNKQSKINIPVPFSDNFSSDHYQVLFRFSSTNIRSQLLNYQADKDKDVPPAMPTIVSVDNLYVTPPEQDAADQSVPSQIQFDLEWQAIGKEDLEKVFQTRDADANRDNDKTNDAVYYELAINTLPGETNENKYEVIQVYKVTKAADGTYRIQAHPSLAADSWQGSPSQIQPQYVHGYDKINELFRMQNIILNKNGQWAFAHKAVYDEDNRKYTVTAETAKRINDPAFPGVNYLRLRAYTEKDGQVMRSRQSMPYSFSMSMLVYDVPTANNLRYEPIYHVNGAIPEGVGIYWDWNKNKTDFKTFREAMLEPLGKSAVSIKYVGYISQNRQELMKITAEDKQNLLELVAPETQDTRKIRVTPQQREDFRAGKVFYFEAKDLNLEGGKLPGGEFLTQITGLDPNAVYYVRFVIEIQVQNADGSFELDAAGEKKPRLSTPSVILEMTVPKVNPEPGDNEKLPLSPDQFRVGFVDDEKVQSFAEWDFPSTIKPEENNYGFELLNVEDQALAAELRENTISLEDLVSGSSSEEATRRLIEKYGIHKNNVQAYRVIKILGEWELQGYDPVTKTWGKAQQADFSMEDNKIKVIDKRNSPNRVLYYYVRTLKYNDGGAVLSRSRWREAALTTPELKRPIHLTVDYSSTVDHNPRYERIVYFDVPLPEGVKLHENYLVQIFVRGEKDADYIQAGQAQANGQIVYGSAFLKSAPGAPNNYQRLYYKIYGLEPSKAYDIKVRLEDHTKDKEKRPDGSFSYVTSPFSDVVRTRTEFDQSSQDKEDKYKEQIKHFLKQAEELKKKPYFDLSIDSKKNVFKYRGPHAAGEMKSRAGGKYELAEGTADTVVYYLPAEMIKAAPESATDLKLFIQNQQFLLPDGFVSEESTAAIREAVKKIKEYQGSAKDYTVMIELTAGKYTMPIQGEIPTEKFVNLSISVLRESQTETYIDQMLEGAIDNAVSRNKPVLIAELEKELKYGIKEEKLNEIVNKVMEQVRKDFASNAQFRYFSLLQQTSKGYITEPDKEIKVILQPAEKTAYQVYFREKANWQLLDKGSDDSVKSKKTGSFLAMKDPHLQKLVDTAASTELSEIKKNRLEKVFRTQELTENGVITGEQLIRTAARILGAGDSNDTAAFLRGKGILVPGYDRYAGISREQAYYILAQTYAKKHNSNLSSIRVTDFNAIEDQKEIDGKYRKEILAAEHLRLVTLRNGKLSPKAQFTMNELRNFLKKL